MHISPCLSWKDEFDHVKLKMKKSIKRLIIADKKLHQVFFHFNVCMLTKFFFGCGIVSFNKKQCKELKDIFELLTIRKMRLGDNFPQKMMHVKKTSLGAGLIELKR